MSFIIIPYVNYNMTTSQAVYLLKHFLKIYQRNTAPNLSHFIQI